MVGGGGRGIAWGAHDACRFSFSFGSSVFLMWLWYMRLLCICGCFGYAVPVHTRAMTVALYMVYQVAVDTRAS